MFLKFKTNEERRNHGGTAFVEFQFCRLKANSKIRKIVSVNRVQNWKDDSLYLFVDDIDDFCIIRTIDIHQLSSSIVRVSDYC